MPTGTIQSVVSISGLSIQTSVTRTESGLIGQEVTLDAAVAGALSTRTDDDTGVITVAEGHGITDADTVDVYWDGGIGYNYTVTSYDGTTISIDGGVGDVLPSQSTAVTVGVQTTIDVDFDGDLLEMIAAGATYRGHIGFHDVGDAVLAAVELVAGELWSWLSGQGITNPLTGNPVAYVLASNGDSAAASTITIAGLYDSA